MRPANRAERTLDASARGRAMRLAAPTDVRHSLPRSRRFRCLCTGSDTVVSSKNLSKHRRPTPRYRYFQIDTKNGRLTPIRIVLARNILRAHPTLVPKRGCVSAPAMVPLWSGLFYCRALRRKGFPDIATGRRRQNRLSQGNASGQAAACHLMLADRPPERLARHLRMSREPSRRRSPCPEVAHLFITKSFPKILGVRLSRQNTGS